MRSGKAEGVPYSLSRWTDVVAAKWPWFLTALQAERMEAFDPQTGVPSWWSLAPAETLGLVFWTKNPTNLIADRNVIRSYQVKVHVTATGWHEVEKGAPSLDEACQLLQATVDAFGVENVTWRFSPVPLLPVSELIGRFFRLAEAASRAGLREVYLSFLQTNDLLPETRSWAQRLHVLDQLAIMVGAKFGINLRLCNEDRTLERWGELLDLNGDPVGPPPTNLSSGVCANPADYGAALVRKEGCGCVLMADPFTINESCTMGCVYCYAADQTLSGKKRNTTRSLPVIR